MREKTSPPKPQIWIAGHPRLCSKCKKTIFSKEIYVLAWEGSSDEGGFHEECWLELNLEQAKEV